MDKNKKWIDYIIELQSLAQAGLTYGKDVYDQERYERIRQLSAMMMADISNKPVEQVEGLFCNEVGYQTPKIDTRAAIFKEDKILLVQEKNGKHILIKEAYLWDFLRRKNKHYHFLLMINKIQHALYVVIF